MHVTVQEVSLMASSESGFPQFLSALSCRSKVVIRSASVSKGGLRTLLLNSGDQITKIYQGQMLQLDLDYLKLKIDLGYTLPKRSRDRGGVVWGAFHDAARSIPDYSGPGARVERRGHSQIRLGLPTASACPRLRKDSGGSRLPRQPPEPRQVLAPLAQGRPRSQSVREQAEEGEPSRTTGSRPSMQTSPSCPSLASSCVGAGLLLSRRSGNRTPVYLLPHSHPTGPVHIEIRARLYKG